MTIGSGGKYDAECELLLAVTGAVTTCAIVVDGRRGTGFSMSTRDPRHIGLLAGVLREVADQLEADARKLAQ
jgi:hypothetical protein